MENAKGLGESATKITATATAKVTSVVSDSVRPQRQQPTRLLRPWDSPGQNTGVGSLSFLQEIFPTQESNQGLLHCRQILYQLSYQSGCLKHYSTRHVAHLLAGVCRCSLLSV